MLFFFGARQFRNGTSLERLQRRSSKHFSSNQSFPLSCAISFIQSLVVLFSIFSSQKMLPQAVICNFNCNCIHPIVFFIEGSDGAVGGESKEGGDRPISAPAAWPGPWRRMRRAEEDGSEEEEMAPTPPTASETAGRSPPYGGPRPPPPGESGVWHLYGTLVNDGVRKRFVAPGGGGGLPARALPGGRHVSRPSGGGGHWNTRSHKITVLDHQKSPGQCELK